jgi:hypothetical protein
LKRRPDRATFQGRAAQKERGRGERFGYFE